MQDKELYQKLSRLIIAKFQNEEGYSIQADFNGHNKPHAINGEKPDVIVSSTSGMVMYIEVETSNSLPGAKEKWNKLSNSKEIKDNEKGLFCLMVQKKDFELAKNLSKAWSIFIDKIFIDET